MVWDLDRCTSHLRVLLCRAATFSQAVGQGARATPKKNAPWSAVEAKLGSGPRRGAASNRMGTRCHSVAPRPKPWQRRARAELYQSVDRPTRELGPSTDSFGEVTGGFAHMHHDVKNSNKKNQGWLWLFVSAEMDAVKASGSAPAAAGPMQSVRVQFSGVEACQCRAKAESISLWCYTPRLCIGASPLFHNCCSDAFPPLSLVQNTSASPWLQKDISFISVQ